MAVVHISSRSTFEAFPLRFLNEYPMWRNNMFSLRPLIMRNTNLSLKYSHQIGRQRDWLHLVAEFSHIRIHIYIVANLVTGTRVCKLLTIWNGNELQ